MGGGGLKNFAKVGATVATGGISDVLGYGIVNDAVRPQSKSVGTPLDSQLQAAQDQELATTILDATNNQNVDDTTKLEIQNFAKQQTGIVSPREITASIKATIKTAEAGQGVYGVRLKNQQERSILADMPGRIQTVTGGL